MISQCPNCKMKYELQESAIWRQAKCKQCNTIFSIESFNENSGMHLNDDTVMNKRFIKVIIILISIIIIIYWISGIINWNKEHKRNVALNSPIKLWECSEFTKKLLSCEAISCSYNMHMQQLDWEVEITNTISWVESNCSHTQEVKIEWKIYSLLECSWLSSSDLQDMAHDYDITMNSNGSKISTEINIANWISKLEVDGKVLKNTLMKLNNNGKCSTDFPWMHGFK